MPAYLTSRLPQIQAAARPKAQAAVQKTVMDVEAQAKGFAAVDTGNMRALVQGSMTGDLSGEVNAGAHYSIYNEYGTSKMAAQPFMTPAAESARGTFEQAMSQIVS